jgi:hypothetical protein
MSNEWQEGDDDFITKREARQETMQTLANTVTRASLEKAYFDVRPDHQPLKGQVYSEYVQYVAAHPEKQADLLNEMRTGQVQAGQIGPTWSEAFYAISDGVDRGLAAARRRETPAAAGEVDWKRFEPADQDREEGIREAQERYERMRQGR